MLIEQDRDDVGNLSGGKSKKSKLFRTRSPLSNKHNGFTWPPGLIPPAAPCGV